MFPKYISHIFVYLIRTDDVYDAKNQTIPRPHSEIRAVRVARDRSGFRCTNEELVHFGWASNFRTRSVHGEYECEDNGK